MGKDTFAPLVGVESSRGSAGRDLRLRLFGGFAVGYGDRQLAVSSSAQRIIALVALRGTVTRDLASGVLWPEIPEDRARSRLRTLLWRVQGFDREILHSCGGELTLAPGVEVDFRVWNDLALRIIDRPDTAADLDLATLRPAGDLLPGWYDDWVLVERERVRQLRLHALETAADVLLRAGRRAVALDLALGALQMEETRESAHRLVIQVHLAEGNMGEAWRQFERCQTLLAREFGIEPSAQLRRMLSLPIEGWGTSV